MFIYATLYYYIVLIYIYIYIYICTHTHIPRILGGGGAGPADRRAFRADRSKEGFT